MNFAERITAANAILGRKHGILETLSNSDTYALGPVSKHGIFVACLSRYVRLGDIFVSRPGGQFFGVVQ